MNKTMLISLFMLLCGTIMQAQVKIGGNAEPLKGAVLDLNSNVKGGLLLPNVDITDLGKIPVTFSDASVRGADDAPALAGMIVWNTHPDNEGVYMWDGSDWKLLSGGTATPPTDCTVPPSGVSISGFEGPYNLNAEFAVTCNATVTGQTLYTWSVSDPGLTIVSGNGTSRIIVKGTTGKTYAGTSISCAVQNACGTVASANASTSLIVYDCSAAPSGYTVSAISGTIDQNATFTVSCSGTANGATTYAWTVPTELRITAGQGSTTITVQASIAGPIQGSEIVCTIMNSCGSANPTSSGFLTIRPVAGEQASSMCAWDKKEECTCPDGLRTIGYGTMTSSQRTEAAQAGLSPMFYHLTQSMLTARLTGGQWVTGNDQNAYLWCAK